MLQAQTCKIWLWYLWWEYDCGTFKSPHGAVIVNIFNMVVSLSSHYSTTTLTLQCIHSNWIHRPSTPHPPASCAFLKLLPVTCAMREVGCGLPMKWTNDIHCEGGRLMYTEGIEDTYVSKPSNDMHCKGEGVWLSVHQVIYGGHSHHVFLRFLSVLADCWLTTPQPGGAARILATSPPCQRLPLEKVLSKCWVLHFQQCSSPQIHNAGNLRYCSIFCV